MTATMLQVRDRTADIPVVHVAVADELHYRARTDNARWSLCFILLGLQQEKRPAYVSYSKLTCKICQVGCDSCNGLNAICLK